MTQAPETIAVYVSRVKQVEAPTEDDESGEIVEGGMVIVRAEGEGVLLKFQATVLDRYLVGDQINVRFARPRPK